ncbi:MAG: NFACT family protein [Bacteroidota bacterium]
MIANYYTLRHIALDLDRQCSGLPLEELYCQNSNELLITFGDRASNRTLLISCEPSANFLYVRADLSRARKNSVDVLQGARGKQVRSTQIAPADREIRLTLEDDSMLLIQLFGSRANVLLADPHGKILDSFLRSKEESTAPPTRAHRETPTPVHAEELQSRLQTNGMVLLSAALKQVFPLFGPVLILELCTRAEMDRARVVGELRMEEIERLHFASRELFHELDGKPAPRVYSDNGTPVLFAPIPLLHMRGRVEELFDSIHDAIRFFIGRSRKQKSFFQEQEALVRFLESHLERAERTLQKMASETQALERAATYETFAKLLMMNLHHIPHGVKEVEIEDVFAPGRAPVAIPLEPKLSPARNAERYFEKAKKARAAVGDKIERREELDEHWQLLRRLRDQLGPIQTVEQLREFLSAHGGELEQVGFKGTGAGGTKQKEEVPFRTFTVDGGFQVWAGKSSENNDLLTTKYAKPNDYWFHARGSSGSHVILRAGTGKGEPGKKALEQAASVAAYYSKMKKAKNIPVAMTLKKYVRKPKGAPVGTVTIEREKVLFVDPELPAAKG